MKGPLRGALSAPGISTIGLHPIASTDSGIWADAAKKPVQDAALPDDKALPED